MREVVFDTETTGFNAQGDDRLVEIGCVELMNRVETGRTFHAYYNPQRDMPQGAFEVHGLSEAFLSDKALFADGIAELMEFLGDAPLIAHNANFDFGFINAELSRAGHGPVSMDRMVDTLAMAKIKHPGAKNSLDALCVRYGVDRSHRIKHGALLDAQLLSQIYVELAGGRQIGFELPQEEIEAVILPASMGAAEAASTARPLRHFTPSDEELERHRAFVDTLSNPLWKDEEAKAVSNS